MSVRICFHDHTEVQIEPIHSKKKTCKIFNKRDAYYTFYYWRPFLSKYFSWYGSFKNDIRKKIICFYFFHCYVFLLPGEISKDVSAQFLNRNRHGDSRCDTDQKYCESHRVRCMVRYSINCLDAQICVYTLLQSNIYKDEAQLLLM